jgi:hypothetical protein
MDLTGRTWFPEKLQEHYPSLSQIADDFYRHVNRPWMPGRLPS